MQSLLTYKLFGEDEVRASGMPYTVVRPCALTEEPAGMPVELAQGDTIQGKIGRDDVADLCCTALQTPELVDTTFEVRTTLDTQEKWTGPQSGETPTKRDWAQLAREYNIRRGVTGRTIEVDGVMIYTGTQTEEEARQGAQAQEQVQ